MFKVEGCGIAAHPALAQLAVIENQGLTTDGLQASIASALAILSPLSGTHRAALEERIRATESIAVGALRKQSLIMWP